MKGSGSESPLSPSDEKYLAVTQGGGERNCIRGLVRVRGPGATRLSLGHSEDDDREDVDSLDTLEDPRAPARNILDSEIMLK